MRTTAIPAPYPHDHDLRMRLQAWWPDEPGIPLPFTLRLAQENGWEPAHARKVTREYLRFVYLAMTAGHPVTPSQAVDEAWHLHLTYTRSYWDGLCGGILGRPLHHDSTRGGTEEEAKFADWYARTLESYRAAFLEGPPRDVWPAPEQERPKGSAAWQAHVAAQGDDRILIAAAMLVAAILIFALTPSGDGFSGSVMGRMLIASTVSLGGAWLAFRSVENGGRHRGSRGGGGGCAGLVCSGGGGDGGHHHGGCGGHGGCGHGGCGAGGCGHGGCGGGH